VALCDVDDVRAAKSYKAFPKLPRYKDFRRLLEKEKGIDAVTVGTPDHTHATIAMAAMQLGKHVYCEKPLAHTMYEVRKMTETARKYNVATQLGNQGHSFLACREFCECIWAGAIGDVREVHAVMGHPRGAPSGRLPDHTPAVPKTLDWDLWLGPAPYRKYSPRYCPESWRGWRQFGSGAIGDWLCHVVDPVFWALDLGAPTSILAEAEGYDPQKHSEAFPKAAKIRFEFPARGNRPAVKLYWYEGDQYRPPSSEELTDGKEPMPVPGWQPFAVGSDPKIGALVIGDKGKLVYGSHGARDWSIYPKSKMKAYMGDRKRLDRAGVRAPGIGNVNHHRDWLRACKGWEPAGSNFDYGGPLTELAMLGNISTLMVGTELQWDAERMNFPNHPDANWLLHFRYRDGWTL